MGFCPYEGILSCGDSVPVSVSHNSLPRDCDVCDDVLMHVTVFVVFRVG